VFDNEGTPVKTSSVVLVRTTSIAALLAASSAFAAQNVANTSQKGSLLIWPFITVDQLTGSTWDTVVEISNDATSTVHVECEYVNEEKGRVNFDFVLTAKQTVSWDVSTQNGDHVAPPQFPTNVGNPPPPFTADPYRGELVCFATNRARTFQIAWNELTGTATVMNLNPSSVQPKQDFKYNAWAFAARNATGLARDRANRPHGRAGEMLLSGANAAGAYDACPAYNVANFMPNGAKLGNLTTINNSLSVVSCNQDLRESYNLHLTKLDFTVWNSNEQSLTGAYACVDSVETVYLNGTSSIVQGSNFNFSTLKTPNARFQVDGISATPPCAFPTESSGLLGVIESSTAIAPDTSEDSETGNTTQHAGVEAGYVRWDPAGKVLPQKK
jgi:hypothetical protein